MHERVLAFRILEEDVCHTLYILVLKADKNHNGRAIGVEDMLSDIAMYALLQCCLNLAERKGPRVRLKCSLNKLSTFTIGLEQITLADRPR